MNSTDAETRQPLVKLPREPAVKFLHDRTALGLVQLEPGLWRQFLLPGDRVVVANHPQRLQHVATLLRKIVHHADELPPGVGHAVGNNRFQFEWQVA